MTSAAVAAARVRVKRKIRAAGLPVPADATRAELAALLRAVRALAALDKARGMCHHAAPITENC